MLFRSNLADINEQTFSTLLEGAYMPDPDLVIRTSGEMRLSNFLTWQCAYSELYITDVLWPDFDRTELLKALTSYAQRERRFGAVAASKFDRNSEQNL